MKEKLSTVNVKLVKRIYKHLERNSRDISVKLTSQYQEYCKILEKHV